MMKMTVLWSNILRARIRLITALFLLFVSLDASAQYRLEFSTQSEITSQVPANGWDIRQIQPIEFLCNWGVLVGNGTWANKGDEVIVQAFAARNWVTSQADPYANLQNLTFAIQNFQGLVLSTWNAVAANGNQSMGKAFGGQFKASFKPEYPGNWLVGCYVTAPKIYKALEINNRCDGTTYAWCAVSVASVFISQPEPFTVAEIPELEILTPVKAPGEEVVTISLDINGVSLSARIPETSVTREKTKQTAVPCGVYVDDQGKKVGEDCQPVYFWDWAVNYTQVFQERWHLELLKRQGNGAFKQIESYSGLVSQQVVEKIVSRRCSILTRTVAVFGV